MPVWPPAEAKTVLDDELGDWQEECFGRPSAEADGNG